MKLKVVYSFEDGDRPSPKDLLESFNLLREFAPELGTDHSGAGCGFPPERKAYNRVVKNAAEFDRDDVVTLIRYGGAVAQRALEKYSAEPFNGAPWAESVKQNAQRLLGAMAGLQNLCAITAIHAAERGGVE